MWFDSRDEIVHWEGNPILLDHSIPEGNIWTFIFWKKNIKLLNLSFGIPDPDVLKALKPWKKLADIKGKQIVGSTKVYLDGKYVCRRGECNMGNLITDSMVDYVSRVYKLFRSTFPFFFVGDDKNGNSVPPHVILLCFQNIGKDENKYFWTRAAIGVINVGGIRSSISNDPETIRFEDIVGVQPFENTLDTVEFLGRSILRVKCFYLYKQFSFLKTNIGVCMYSYFFSF